jgi:hypothetical protein
VCYKDVGLKREAKGPLAPNRHFYPRANRSLKREYCPWVIVLFNVKSMSYLTPVPLLTDTTSTLGGLLSFALPCIYLFKSPFLCIH